MRFAPHTCIHVTESLGGGVLTSILSITEAQSKVGISTRLLYLERPDSPDYENLKTIFASTRVIRVGKSNLWGFIKLHFSSFKLLSNKKSHQIIHVHSTVAGAILRFPNLIFRKPIHYTPHCYAFIRQDINRLTRLFYKQIEKFLSTLTPTIVLGCSYFETDYGKNLGSYKAKYLGNYVTVPNSYPEKVVTLHPKDLQIATIGRVTRQKNLPRYIELLESIEQDMNIMWIGGDKRHSISITKNKSIEFTGWLAKADVALILERMDIFLLLSDWEGLPFVVLEAMSKGIPVILWNFDGAAELIPNENIGYRVNSLEQARQALYELKSNAEKRRNIGVAGFEHVRVNFNNDSLPTIVSQLYECCE